MALPHTEPLQPVTSLLPDWDDFRLLLAVAQLGSITRAAQALGVSQPTVSRRVERLEATIGVRLLDTFEVRVRWILTAEGQRIVEELPTWRCAIQRAVQVGGIAADAASMKIQLRRPTGSPPIGYRASCPISSSAIAISNFASTRRRNPRGENRGRISICRIHYIQPTDPNLIAVRLGTLHFAKALCRRIICARKARPGMHPNCRTIACSITSSISSTKARG